jgi:hypothetical protein
MVLSERILLQFLVDAEAVSRARGHGPLADVVFEDGAGHQSRHLGEVLRWAHQEGIGPRIAPPPAGRHE